MHIQTIRFSTPSTLIADNTEAENTSINLNENSSNKIEVYPNPATSLLHIKLNNGNSIVILKDINGKTVWSAQGSNNSSINADVSKLDNGVYLLQIINTDKTVTTQKIIVNR